MPTVRATFLLTCCLLAASVANGQAFRFRVFPAKAPLLQHPVEVRSSATRVEMHSVNQVPVAYPWSPVDRPLVEAHVALLLPLLSINGGGGQYFVGLPFAVTILEDLLELDSRPVINTDHVLAVELQALWPTGIVWPKTVSLRLRPFFHESCHIGDELAFRMVSDDQAGYYRINVSYNAWEVRLGINEWTLDGGGTLGFRMGAAGLWSDTGYYNMVRDAELGSDVPTIVPSRRRFELFGEIYAVLGESLEVLGDWRIADGASVHARPVFDYFSDAPEQMPPSVSAFVGVFRASSVTPRPWFYLRASYGQMPWGMFRERYGLVRLGGGMELEF